MPIMKTETIVLHGEHLKRIIKWNGRKEHFESNLPSYIADVVEDKTITGATIASVRKAWDAKVERYNKLKTTERKIICFQYNGSSELEKGKPEPPDEDQKKESFMHEYGQQMQFEVKIELGYWVGFEVGPPGEKEYRDIHGNSQSVSTRGSYDRDRLIDWTPERETFFAALIKHLHNANKEAEKFFSKQPKKLLAAIESRHKLLGLDSE